MVARANERGLTVLPGYADERSPTLLRRLNAVIATGWAAPVLGLIVVAGLAFFKLESYPRTWFDEGLNLLGAKILAQTGQYGLQTADGFSAFDIGLSTGPTVIAPTAVLFKVLGIGLIQARLVTAAYIVLAAAGLYWAGRQLFDRSVGTVAILAFAALTQAGPFSNGRHLLGDIAGLAYLFWGAGTLAWARRTDSTVLHALAGLLFGLAILTKNQLALIAPIVPALWLIALVRPTGRLPLRHLAWLLFMMAMPTIGWYLCQFVVMGPTDFLTHLASLRGEASASLVVAPLRKTAAAVDTLLNAGFAVWGLAGLVYVVLLALREEWWRHPQRLVLPAFAVLWLVFFVGFSIGWDRYAVPVVITTSLFVAKLICDLARRVWPASRPRGVPWGRVMLADPLATSVLVLLAGALVSGIVLNGLTIARARDSSPQVFASLVRQQVEPGALAESSEWEIDFLTDRIYHHPPAALVIQSIGAVFLDRPALDVQAYQASPDASYMVDGPFSKLTGMYRTELSGNTFTRVASYGEYDLYRRK